MTYNGTITTLTPQLNTIWAAYGSVTILNYAEGDQLPNPIAPPIIVIPDKFDNMLGNALIKTAKLVIAPVTTKLTFFGCLMIFWYTSHNAFYYIAFFYDFLSYAPSKPDAPCISAASDNSWHNGFVDPL